MNLSRAISLVDVFTNQEIGEVIEDDDVAPGTAPVWYYKLTEEEEFHRAGGREFAIKLLLMDYDGREER